MEEKKVRFFFFNAEKEYQKCWFLSPHKSIFTELDWDLAQLMSQGAGHVWAQGPTIPLSFQGVWRMEPGRPSALNSN